MVFIKNQKFSELFPQEQLQHLTTSINYNGYTVVKEQLTKSQINFLKAELTMKPKTIPGYDMNIKKYELYLENEKKLYLPKAFGIHYFGLPKLSKLSDGDNINIPFNGILREFQTEVVDTYLDCQMQQKNKALLSVATGLGKCLKIDTPIMMFDGTIKKVQDIKVGDKIMGDDSTPRNVLSLARGREMMYDIIPTKGDTYTVNESHILSLRCSYTLYKTESQEPIIEAQFQNQKYIQNKIIDISVRDFIKLPKMHQNHLLKGYRVPIDFPEKEIDIEPYALGYWLGNRISSSHQITTEDKEVIEYFQKYCDELELNLKQGKDSKKKENNYMLNMLRKHNLIENKHIPHIYKCNSREIRLKLLAGIIDSDGHYSKCGYDIIQKNETLLDDIIFLARTLGFAAYKSKCEKSCMYKCEKKTGTYYRTTIHGKGLENIPVKLERKKAMPRKQIKNVLNTGIKVIKKEIDDYYGFEIDGNRRFVLGDCTVTHNTIMACNIISKLAKKTLIVVHQTFLINQWIERINQFLPSAKIGIIKQNKKQIIGNDIVIASLQSLAMKDYDIEEFKCFGLVVIDEIHASSGEIFKNMYYMVNFKYCLGLSATMQRKDGLEKVYYYFFGDVAVHKELDVDSDINVNIYEYNSSDEAYCKEYLLYGGKPNLALMMTNVTCYKPRCQKLIKIISSIFIKDITKQRKILLLSDRREHLSMLYDMFHQEDKLKDKNVGYYVGGMKQKDLDNSAKCDLILATSKLAATGLDISGLNTLILASPISSITQAIGRILRVPKEQRTIKPLIVDIADRIRVFNNQAKKREVYYRKNKYTISMCDIDNIDFTIANSENEINSIISEQKVNKPSKKKIKAISNIDDALDALDSFTKINKIDLSSYKMNELT